MRSFKLIKKKAMNTDLADKGEQHNINSFFNLPRKIIKSAKEDAYSKPTKTSQKEIKRKLKKAYKHDIKSYLDKFDLTKTTQSTLDNSKINQESVINMNFSQPTPFRR